MRPISQEVAVDSSMMLAELVRERSLVVAPIRITGASTWMDAGRPGPESSSVSLRALRTVADYVPGNLTITVGAGMTLRELREITAANGQWLPVDPFGSDDGTIGATVATGSSGPLSTGFGRIRDLILGVEIVTGRGEVIRGGGRVVKNVAGFDIARLATGSWGTLGAITEVSLRLYARPARDVTVAVAADGDVSAATSVLGTLAVQPWAAELIGPELARRRGFPFREIMLVRIGGNEAAVEAQLRTLASLGGAIVDSADATWTGLRGAERGGESVFRISARPSDFARTWAVACAVVEAAGSGYAHASPLRGVSRVVVPETASASIAILRELADDRVRVVFERLNADDWSTLSPSVTDDRVSRGIKSSFDPMNIFNPGILGS